ncbi:MAG TPA: hypothetical protein VGN57_23355 [Pirellulaceae bacterium]|nr:hypothetical protein [Pirellulaceae bacterium]
MTISPEARLRMTRTKFYVVDAISCFIQYRRISEFHHTMFHGIALRDGKEYPHDAIVYADTPDPSPLTVVRSIRNVPRVWKPSMNLVVDENLANALNELPNLRLQQVEFERLVDIDYRTGVHGYQDVWGIVRPDVLLRTQPRLKEPPDGFGRWYEVQQHLGKNVAKRFEEASAIVCRNGTPPFDSDSKVRLSSQMLREYPILAFPGFLVVGEEAFATIGPALDLDYFIVREFKTQ